VFLMSEVPLYRDGSYSRQALAPEQPPTSSQWRLIDSCITHNKAQGPARICNASEEEVISEEPLGDTKRRTPYTLHPTLYTQHVGCRV